MGVLFSFHSRPSIRACDSSATSFPRSSGGRHPSATRETNWRTPPRFWTRALPLPPRNATVSPLAPSMVRLSLRALAPATEMVRAGFLPWRRLHRRRRRRVGNFRLGRGMRRCPHRASSALLIAWRGPGVLCVSSIRGRWTFRSHPRVSGLAFRVGLALVLGMALLVGVKEHLIFLRPFLEEVCTSPPKTALEKKTEIQPDDESIPRPSLCSKRYWKTSSVRPRSAAAARLRIPVRGHICFGRKRFFPLSYHLGLAPCVYVAAPAFHPFGS